MKYITVNRSQCRVNVVIILRLRQILFLLFYSHWVESYEYVINSPVGIGLQSWFYRNGLLENMRGGEVYQHVSRLALFYIWFHVATTPHALCCECLGYEEDDPNTEQRQLIKLLHLLCTNSHSLCWKYNSNVSYINISIIFNMFVWWGHWDIASVLVNININTSNQILHSHCYSDKNVPIMQQQAIVKTQYKSINFMFSLTRDIIHLLDAFHEQKGEDRVNTSGKIGYTLDLFFRVFESLFV